MKSSSPPTDTVPSTVTRIPTVSRVPAGGLSPATLLQSQTQTQIQTETLSSSLSSKSLRESLWNPAKPFVLGGSATIMATTCIQPIDMVKVRLQLSDASSSSGPLQTARHILRHEGFRTFYSGYSAAVFRQMTNGTTRFGVFAVLEDHFADENGHLPLKTRLAISLFAGGLAGLVGTPADAALVRMQADTLLSPSSPLRRGYRHVGDALLRMTREEGLRRGFFAGASPTIYRGLAVNMGNLGTYGAYKQAILHVTDLPDGRTAHVLSGICSGTTGATISLPFDFVKTRLQKMAKDPVTGQYPYRGFVDCLTKSVRREGPLVLYRGYIAYVCRIVPHVTLTWTFLETLRRIPFLK